MWEQTIVFIISWPPNIRKLAQQAKTIIVGAYHCVTGSVGTSRQLKLLKLNKVLPRNLLSQHSKSHCVIIKYLMYIIFFYTKCRSCETDMMKKLPAEVLLKIFDFLPVTNLLKCRLVCTFWHSVIKPKKIWFTMNSIYSTQSVKERLKLPIMSHVSKLELLNISTYSTSCNAKEILTSKEMKRLYPKLTMLSFQHCLLNEKIIIYILKQCTKLQTLHLNYMILPLLLDRETDRKMLRISLKHVTELDLNHNFCHYFNFDNIIGCLPNIRDVILPWSSRQNCQSGHHSILERVWTLKSLKICLKT